ncbi:MAG: helix-turn-helix domain-containing protein [Pirellulales bacterium]
MTRNIAREMIDGLNELADAMKRGEDISRKFNVRQVALRIKPAKYTPALVKKTRKTLNASQALFARFLGVAPTTVRAWERGANTPSEMAARFMDEIRHDPRYWKSRFMSVAEFRPSGRRAAASVSRKRKRA